MQLFKALGENGRAHHGGSGVWPLPNGAAGDWLEIRGDLVPGENGLHLCHRRDILDWLGPTLYVAEHGGDMIECDDKIVARRARLIERVQTWNATTARLFAADCAERILSTYEQDQSDDVCVHNAIEIARNIAAGEPGCMAAVAVRIAARNAAWDVGGDMGWARERAWQQTRLFEYLDGCAQVGTNPSRSNWLA
jgi:hypothetical protein